MNDTFSKQNDQFTNHHEILAVYICMTDIRANLGWHYNTLFSNVKKNLLYISQCSITDVELYTHAFAMQC